MATKSADEKAAHLGARVRELRENRQLNQIELAELAGLSQPHISQIESGRVKPGWAEVLSIAEALDVEVGELAECPKIVHGPARMGRPPKQTA